MRGRAKIGVGAALLGVVATAAVLIDAAASANPSKSTTGTVAVAQSELLVLATDIATTWARRAGVTGEVQMSSVETTEADAQAFLAHEPRAETGGPAAIAEWHVSPVSLIVLTAPDGSSFAPNVPVPEGEAVPQGRVGYLIVEQNSGMIVGQAIGKTALSLTPLGGVTDSVIPAEAVTAHAADSEAPHPPDENDLSTIAGIVKVGGRPAVGWHVLAQYLVPTKPKPRIGKPRVVRTFFGGQFKFVTYVGYYRLTVRGPDGKACARKTVFAHARQTLKVSLTCSKEH